MTTPALTFDEREGHGAVDCVRVLRVERVVARDPAEALGDGLLPEARAGDVWGGEMVRKRERKKESKKARQTERKRVNHWTCIRSLHGPHHTAPHLRVRHSRSDPVRRFTTLPPPNGSVGDLKQSVGLFLHCINMYIINVCVYLCMGMVQGL